MSLCVLYEWFPTKTTDKGFWTLSQSADNNSIDHLLVNDNCVKWYRGIHPEASVLQKVFTTDSVIIESFWCTFDDFSKTRDDSSEEKNLRCLCVREQVILTFFMDNGEIHYVPLPFMISGVWPLRKGLLLERKQDSDESDGLAVLFTLSHPLDDLCPVTFRIPTSIKNNSSSSIGYFTSPLEHVISVCCADPTLVILYNSNDHIHTIYAIRQAKTEDIPSPVSTPGNKMMSSVFTTPHPLSSSAPACYTRNSPSTPIKFSLQVEPSPMVSEKGSTVTKRKSLNTPLADTLKPLPLQRLQRYSPYGFTHTPPKPKTRWSLGANSGGSSVSSGRSPFVTRYKTPLNGQQPSWNLKHAKSLSPQMHYARISPYSQTMNSQSWSTFYSEATLSEHMDLLPQMCLHRIWFESHGEERFGYHAADSVFLTCDWTMSEYIVMHISSIQQLWFLSKKGVEDSKDVDISNDCISKVVGVKKAVNLDSMDMVLVLTTDRNLELYNGFRKVCNIPMFSRIGFSLNQFGNEDISIIDTIRDPLGSELSLVTCSGQVYRCSITEPPVHPIVSLCLQSLCNIFSSETTVQLMTSYYCTFSSLHGSKNHWERFEEWLLSCVGLKDDEVTLNQHIQSYFKTSLLYKEVIQDPVLRLILSETDSQAQTPSQLLKNFSPLNGNDRLDVVHLVSLNQHISCVTSTLHLVYEDIKLDIHYHHHSIELASLLYKLTCHLNWSSYIDHYARDHPALLHHMITRKRFDSGSHGWTNSDSAMTEDEPLYLRTYPPGVYQWLCAVLNKQKVQPYPVLAGVCKRTERVIKLYTHLLRSWNVLTDESLWELVGDANLSTQTSEMEIETCANTTYSIDSIISFLIHEGFNINELHSLPIGVSLPIWNTLLQCRISPPSIWSPEAYNLIGRSDISQTLLYREKSTALKLEPTIPGLIQDMMTAAHQQPTEDDDGMNFDEEILNLRFPHDIRVREVRRLLQSSKSVRIAIEQKPEVSDHEFVELRETHLFLVSQRTMALPVGRGMFTMATVHPIPFAPLSIPKLNLTGRAPPKNSSVVMEHVEKPPGMTDWPEFHNGVAAGLKIGLGISKLDSTWIVFNEPSDEHRTNEYAGFLMALGLNGHLTSLNSFNLFEYLQPKHELTVIGLLLGIGAASCESMNLSTASLLSIFFPPLLPPGSADLETSVLMQTAAMMGIGLLYMNSCNRFMVETLLKQIGHSPGPELEFAQNRECYSLTAGLALGMIALGAGGGSVSLSDLNLVDHLCIYMNGGSKKSVNIQQSSGSHLVLEGDQVNTHITAPGAIVAFGLLYLKTNDTCIAAHLAPPTTPYQLDCIRPDFLMLRALSSGLIMWDSVQPSQDWIDTCIPEVVKQFAFHGGQQKGNENEKIDFNTMSQCLLYITAGCCLALGFRYAGSHRKDVYDFLLQNYHQIFSRMQSAVVIEQAGKCCLESCLHVVLVALAVVMSGSGDLGILRLVRRHHVRVTQQDVTYGKHMATHMALGLLFLGGGRYCLSQSNKAIAALMCALYPHFPATSTDNRYHLQSLRHFYVMATEPRVLVTREWDTGQSCSVPVQLQMEGSCGLEIKEALTPCVLPEWEQLLQIEVTGPRYWSMKLEVLEDSVKQSLIKTGTIYVKRHTGYSTYETDPQGQRSILSLAVLSPHQYQLGSACGKLDVPQDFFIEENWIKEFYHYLCHNGKQFYSAALLNCINKDQLDLLNIYMQLEEISRSPKDGFQGILESWQIKLCQSFSLMSTGDNYLSVTFHEYIESVFLKQIMWIEQERTSLTTDLTALLHYYITGQIVPISLTSKEATVVALSLLLQDIPTVLQATSGGAENLIMILQARGIPPSAAVKTITSLLSPFTQLTV